MCATIKLLLLLLVVTATTLAGHATGTTATTLCVPQERDALLAFKRGIDSDAAGRLASWRKGGDCCQWSGVRCSNRTGHVLELRLGNTRQFSDQFYFTGEISPSLFSLEHLEHLDLSANSLSLQSGGLLGSLKSLRYLNLSDTSLFLGELPPQLGNLSKLQYLDLSDATFSTENTHISWLTRLPSLRHLDLSGVDLSMVHDWPHILNTIPSLRVLYLCDCSLQSANQQLPHFNLTKLERLDLSANDFHHPTKSCWFWNLTNLKYLNLEGNSLFGQFPNTLGQMTSLQVFDFSFNALGDHAGNVISLGGIIAQGVMRDLCNLEILNFECGLSYGNMTEIYESLPHCSSSRPQVLDLSGNNITGTLPAGIARFTSLVILDISGNHLTGHVPSEIGFLNNLTHLNLEYNKLTGFVTEEHFSGLTSLKSINLSCNSMKIAVDPSRLPPLTLEIASFASCQMGPRFPSWLQRLTSVDHIDMPNTGITDQFPDWFSTTLSLATFLDFSNNKISGSLPRDLENMSLNYLLLGRNRITGEIPPLPRNLTFFSISNNALSSHVPGSICKSKNLEVLDLGNNRLEGEFPQCVEMRNIKGLMLSNNVFSGKFPPFLQYCTNLTFLDLSGNKLSGRLPTWIVDLMNLQYLRLSYNMFYGTIPFSITHLGEMYDLNLAGNRLAGVIPWKLSSLTCMTGQCASMLGYLNLSVITKRQELYYLHSLPDMVTIDLSSNLLTGVIPDEIASLGGLVNLNLSWNYLTGKIPHMIGSMQSLESLDLSRKELSGEIPWSLSNLTYLACLDLSYNNLSGSIPSGSQLDTLYDNYPYMYSGNHGLCGPPLQRNCPGRNNATKLGDGDPKRSAHVPDSMFFHLGLGSGFVVGLWVVFCTMLFKKTWRIAYFRLFDKVHDKTYVFLVVTWARLAQKALNLTGKLG